MKKLPVFLCLLIFITSTGFSGDTTGRNNKDVPESLKVNKPINEPLPDDAQSKIVVVLDPASTAELLKKTGKISWVDVLNISLQLFTIIAAIIASRIAWKAFRRDKSYRDQMFMTDFNKIMIEHPELRAFKPLDDYIYCTGIELNTPAIMQLSGNEKLLFKGKHAFKISATQEKVEVYSDGQFLSEVASGNERPFNSDSDKEYVIKKRCELKIESVGKVILQSIEYDPAKIKIDAYSHYKLNNFELVFNFEDDEESETAWEKYFEKTYKESKIFRETVINAIEKEAEIYSKSFIDRIKKIPEVKKQIEENERKRKEDEAKKKEEDKKRIIQNDASA